MKPKLKPPATKRLKLKCDEPPLNFAFKFNLRRYSQACDLLRSKGQCPPMRGFTDFPNTPWKEKKPNELQGSVRASVRAYTDFPNTPWKEDKPRPWEPIGLL